MKKARSKNHYAVIKFPSPPRWLAATAGDVTDALLDGLEWLGGQMIQGLRIVAIFAFVGAGGVTCYEIITRGQPVVDHQVCTWLPGNCEK